MEGQDVNIQQESSPAIQDSSEVLASLTPEQRGEWRNTGKLPEQPSKQESAPADTSKETKSVTEPEAEAGKTTQEHKTESKRAPGAEERIRELIAKNKASEARIQELEAGKKEPKADTKPAAKAAEGDPEKYVPLSEDDYFAKNPDKSYDDYMEAKMDHKIEWRLKTEKATAAKAEQERQQAEQLKTIETNWKERVDAAVKAHSDFAEKCDAEFNKLIPAGSLLDGWMIDSELGAEILYHFANHRDELADVLKMSPFALTRKLTKLEDKLAGEPAPEKETKKAPVTEISKAPKPASEVGGRATAPEDEAADAAKAGDFRRFKAERDREELERMKAH